MKPKDHFFMSRTGAIFALTKLGERWCLIGSPLVKESDVLWPVGASTTYPKIRAYVKQQLGFFEMR